MYFPFFRGKQYDLLTIRETTDVLVGSGFIPIIEPVKESLSSLNRCLASLDEAKAECILIANPRYGDHAHQHDNLQDFIAEDVNDSPYITIGILLLETTSIEEVARLYKLFSAKRISFIHSGFKRPKDLSAWLSENELDARQIFIENNCGKIYRRNFKKYDRVLIRDGFKKRTNSKHPEVEEFSDLHLTYTEEGVDGFGDFLIVGDDYSEGGGPAYAVAIHLTYIDEDEDSIMYVHHFKSIRQDSPTDPAGKFLEALNKLIDAVNEPNTKIWKTDAVKEFIRLHEKKHFPGLGTAKKLSMKHHLETMAIFAKREQ
ncbi:sce7725 family protein [Marinobacter sp. M3C]|uniref:sce7725 family protein n=1 Tax=unclassified Marinobacter TaxID=83889 RepID=UPI00200C919F|nr:MULTISPECIES: sce7725 family protein [unclassified Marinobacter]UQG54042.1 sce7725 family protein [Marinobacter sp. M4C]UQG60550.1 sce7725 family protein [Marinobacter sp. M3C]UQG62849.1 sce7725 family protein [Marinobacter sp. M2C]UQG67126.1 sce7725 family protein [Marinobacter sp. M1C]